MTFIYFFGIDNTVIEVKVLEGSNPYSCTVGNITIDKLCLVVQQKGLTMWIMEDVALGLLPGPSWRREDL